MMELLPIGGVRPSPLSIAVAGANMVAAAGANKELALKKAF